MIPKIYDGRNKTFFFYSFETSRGSNVQQLLNPTVLIAPWREGNFSNLLPGTIVRDPFSGNPYPNNTIPAAQINPVSRKIQDRFYPLPNFASTRYNYQIPIRSVTNSDNLQTRLNKTINNKNQVSGNLRSSVSRFKLAAA